VAKHPPSGGFVTGCIEAGRALSFVPVAIGENVLESFPGIRVPGKRMAHSRYKVVQLEVGT
jgi:hypothetical protein